MRRTALGGTVDGGAWLAADAGVVGVNSAAAPRAAAPAGAADREALGAPAQDPRTRRQRCALPHATYFKTVLSLDPTDADRWCEYAETLLRQDNARAPEAIAKSPVSATRPSLVLFSRALCARMCAIAIALACPHPPVRMLALPRLGGLEPGRLETGERARIAPQRHGIISRQCQKG
jgi:hypothetical protein